MRPIFIRIICNDKYDNEEHNFIDLFDAAININQIKYISSYIPDDPDYDGPPGVQINTDDTTFVIMGKDPEDIVNMIEDAIARCENK